MATAGAAAVEPVPGIDKNPVATEVHGLPTPRPSEDPDVARIEADNARRQAESQAKPADEGDDKPPSKEQIEEVNRVIKCDKEEYRKILGVNDTYASRNDERQAVIDAFRKVGCLTHRDHNNHKDAGEAFGKVIEAAGKLGIEDDDINDMEKWNGVEDILNVRLNSQGFWEPRNADEMDIDPEPTPWHQNIYKTAGKYLSVLMDDPENARAISDLEATNRQIGAYNTKNGLREDQFLINFPMYVANIKRAAPYMARLRVQADEEAERTLKSINEEFRSYNAQYHYPRDWEITMPIPPSQQTAGETTSPEHGSEQEARQRTDPGAAGGQRPSQQRPSQPQDAEPKTAPSGVSGGPKYRKTMRKPGYVVDGGVLKEIAHWLNVTVGDVEGYRLMLKEEGENGYDIYELVRASKFGKRFGKKVANMLGDEKKLVTGTRKDLEDKFIEDICIAGVAPVRRYRKDEPMGGWEKETKTLICAGFGDKPRFKWYHRSVLGAEFGQKAIDEEMNSYRKDAGQKRPLPPTKRRTRRGRKGHAAVASDDEDEGSISLGEEDTSDEGGGDDEDAEEDDSNRDDDDEEELQRLLKEFQKLKKRVDKKRGKSRNGGPASSEKTKSKRSKAK